MRPSPLRLYAALLATAACAALAGCNRFHKPRPLDQLDATEHRGYGVFEAHCAQCHHSRSFDTLNGPSLRAIFQKPYLPSGAPANDERITATVLHGHGLMPAQPYLDPAYSPGDLQDLLAYLRTL